MSGPRQPIELVVAKGAKHLTKAEIESRRKSEIAPLDGELTPPAYLSGTIRCSMRSGSEYRTRFSDRHESPRATWG